MQRRVFMNRTLYKHRYQYHHCAHIHSRHEKVFSLFQDYFFQCFSFFQIHFICFLDSFIFFQIFCGFFWIVFRFIFKLKENTSTQTYFKQYPNAGQISRRFVVRLNCVPPSKLPSFSSISFSVILTIFSSSSSSMYASRQNRAASSQSANCSFEYELQTV